MMERHCEEVLSACMRNLVLCTLAAFATLAIAGCVAANLATVHGQTKQAATPAPTPAGEDNTQFFTQKVRPVLAQNCYQCHTTEQAGGLRLDSRARRRAQGRRLRPRARPRRS